MIIWKQVKVGLSRALGTGLALIIASIISIAVAYHIGGEINFLGQEFKKTENGIYVKTTTDPTGGLIEE